MPKKKKALPKETTQKQRFIDKAKELGVDPDVFDRVFKKIAPVKSRSEPAQDSEKEDLKPE